MIKKNHDSKFVIYQVLYIFVITVLALKGADLDLSRVISKEDAVDKSVRDSLIMRLDSLYALGLSPKIEIDPNVVVENVVLKDKIAFLNKEMADLSQRIIIPEEKLPEKPKEKVEEQTLLQSPISETQTFIQHTWNKAKNTGSVPTSIIDPKNPNNPIVVIPPGQEKIFDLTDQTEVMIKFGSQQDRIKVVPNRLPEVKIERVTTKMNSSNIYVQELQRITAFTVTILDERPDQLKVTHSGPISVTGPQKDSKGNPVYYVSLNLAPNEARFDEWLDRNGNLRESDGRYKTNFFFTVVDQRSKDKVQVGDSFFFTDFSK